MWSAISTSLAWGIVSIGSINSRTTSTPSAPHSSSSADLAQTAGSCDMHDKWPSRAASIECLWVECFDINFLKLLCPCTPHTRGHPAYEERSPTRYPTQLLLSESAKYAFYIMRGMKVIRIDQSIISFGRILRNSSILPASLNHIELHNPAVSIRKPNKRMFEATQPAEQDIALCQKRFPSRRAALAVQRNCKRQVARCASLCELLADGPSGFT